MIYVRASLDLTGEGDSIARQEEACRALAVARQWDVVAVHADNSVSGYAGKPRPGWDKVLTMVDTSQVDVVIAWAMDRVTRSMTDLEELITLAVDRGVGIATATGDIDLTNDMGRMVARILAAVARGEVERKSARRALADAKRAREGKPPSGGPRAFGYTPGYAETVPEEVAAIIWGAERVIAGASMASIAREWDSRGLRSSMARGEVGWSTRGVSSVLAHPRYAALRTYEGVITGPGTWEAILSEDTHHALRRALLDPSRALPGKRTGGRHSTLLGGTAICGVCGEHLIGSTLALRHTEGPATRTPVYKCSGRACATAPREELDAWVAAAVISRFSEPDSLALLVPTGDGDADAARAAAQGARSRLNGLSTAYAAGQVDLEQLTTGTRHLKATLTAAEDALAACVRVPVASRLATAVNTEGAWGAMDLEERRAVIGAYFTVEIATQRRHRRGGPGRGKTAGGWTPQEYVTLSLQGDR